MTYEYTKEDRDLLTSLKTSYDAARAVCDNLARQIYDITEKPWREHRKEIETKRNRLAEIKIEDADYSDAAIIEWAIHNKVSDACMDKTVREVIAKHNPNFGFNRPNWDENFKDKKLSELLHIIKDDCCSKCERLFFMGNKNED